MKSTKLPFLLIAFLISTLVVNTSCDSECSETKYDIQSVSITPKILNLEDLNELNWSNESELTVNNLAVQMNMNKVFSSTPNNDDDCFPKFEINNKVTNIRLLSNQGFVSSHPAGEDLFTISAFTFDARNFIEKQDFINSFVNESNFSRYYFVFNRNPELQGIHRLVMFMDFEDGTSIESNPIEVLITPIDTTPRPD
ncbi:DUF5034 domain-containing protein [Mongoliibacter ruber]|uniref:Uncharacterized protein DUF5034 n=1 Tax=Mongoliibacter ruber TaxID=1750599 RepID=A0A2T0WTH4_9BACT|nr:DUF5034 domain-containing protein [Mongoliibacter ruber]PRY89978.1 uncharacterized protein DUF5034 [Mongoliibacter ruber]